jgi:two-component system chemotaxis sensor kinase CheA
VSVRDDGRGIRVERIREQALKRGIYTKEQIEGVEAKRLMSLIFEPGFSTQDAVDEHAGRGVGMDIIKANIQQLNGRLRVANHPSKSCEISLVLPAPEEQAQLSEAV